MNSERAMQSLQSDSTDGVTPELVLLPHSVPLPDTVSIDSINDYEEVIENSHQEPVLRFGDEDAGPCSSREALIDDDGISDEDLSDDNSSQDVDEGIADTSCHIMIDENSSPAKQAIAAVPDGRDNLNLEVVGRAIILKRNSCKFSLVD